MRRRFLPRNEGEVATQLQEKAFQVVDQRLFQIALGVFILQGQKLQDIGVLDLLFGRQPVLRQRLGALLEHGRLVAGKGGALIELGADLPVELPHRPAAAQRFGFVEVQRFGGAAAAEEQDVVAP
jgi:hypothetical protein